MGRRNKDYSIDLYHQAYNKLTSMQAFGESKTAAKAMGTEYNKIFSHNTYQTYWKHIKYFIKWVNDKHPESTTLKSAKKYINEWLGEREKEGLSAWTIQTEAKALGKLYGIQPDDPEYYKPPKRKREEIKRSRGTVARDAHFSEKNNDEFVKFCKGVGCRRNVVEKLKGEDLWSREALEKLTTASEAEISGFDAKTKAAYDSAKEALEVFPDQDYYILHYRDKGGRNRLAPIIGDYKEQIVERMKNTAASEKVWLHVPKNADIHSYRGDYATYIYKKYARKIEDIPYDRTNKGTGKKFQGDVYHCRKDESGKKLDRKAMLKCTKALGHNRINVVADNYIRGL